MAFAPSWSTRAPGRMSYARERRPGGMVTSSSPQAHPLLGDFLRLRRRVLWVLLGTRTLIVLGTAVALALLFGLLDYWLRLDDWLIRGVFFVGWTGTLALLTGYLIIRPLVLAWDTVYFARQVEKLFPPLCDRLAAAVDFLRQEDGSPVAGSPALRQAVVDSVWEQLRRVNWSERVRKDLWWYGLAWLLVPIVVFTAFVITWPGLVKVGFRRFFFPWQQVAWPQRFHLVFLRPVVEVARGSDFEVAIVDREGKQLPPGGKVYFRLPTTGGQTVIETSPLVYIDPQMAKRRFGGIDEHLLAGGAWVARRGNVDRAFWFRIEAGDNRSMPWTLVNIAVAPAVEELLAEIVPPDYTGWPVARTTGPLAALAGSRVVLSGQSTKQLAAAALRLGTEGAIPSTVEDTTRFRAEFIAERSTTLWFELTDRSGLVGGMDDRRQLRVFPDNAPTVFWREGRGQMRFTPQARVLLSGEARDDVGLRRVDLSVFKGSGSIFTLTVYQGPPFPPTPGEDFVEKGPPGQREAFSCELALTLLPLQVGDRLKVVAKAEDHRGQVAESPPLTLEIVSAEELLADTLSQHQAIVAELRRALEVEQSAQKLTGEVAQSLDEEAASPGKLTPQLEGALWTQREVARIVGGSSESVLGRVADLLALLSENQLGKAAPFEELSQLQDKLRVLAEGPLPASEEKLLSALRELSWLREGKPPVELAREKTAAAASELKQALASQREIIAILSELVAKLESGGELRRLQQELAQIIGKQRDIRQQTEVQARRTTGRSAEQLLPDEQAALQALAARQRQLAEEFARFHHSLRQWAQLAQEEEPSRLAQLGRKAAGKSAELESRGLLAKTVQDISQNRLGQAIGQQEEILNDLEELEEILREESAVDDTSPSSRSAQALANAVDELSRKQEAVRREYADAVALGEGAWDRKLAQASQMQEEVLKESEKFRNQLDSSIPQAVDEIIRLAQEAMKQAIAEGRKGQGRTALAQAEKAEHLLSQLVDKFRSPSEDQALAEAAEVLGQLVQHLMALQMAQKVVADKTRAVHERLEVTGNLGRSERRQILELADGQTALAEQMGSLSVPSQAALIRQTVQDVRRDMETAASLLKNWQVGVPTQQAQQRALMLLSQLVSSLVATEEEAQEQQPAQSSPSAPEAQAQSAPDEPPGNPYFLIELRLLRNLQAGIHAETAALAEKFGQTSDWPEEARQQAQFLRQEQERLAQLLIELLKSAAGPALQVPADEENPSTSQIPEDPAKNN